MKFHHCCPTWKNDFDHHPEMSSIGLTPGKRSFLRLWVHPKPCSEWELWEFIKCHPK